MTGKTRTEVIRDPAIIGGEPTVSGTRTLAETLLSYLRAHPAIDEVFKDYPGLPVDRIDAVKIWTETTFGADWKARSQAPFSRDAYELQRDPDESEKDYAKRRALFET